MTPRALIRIAVPLFALVVIGASARAADNAALPAAGIAAATVTWAIDHVADIAVRNHPSSVSPMPRRRPPRAAKGQAESPGTPR